jgi:hypothetical protein
VTLGPLAVLLFVGAPAVLERARSLDFFVRSVEESHGRP